MSGITRAPGNPGPHRHLLRQARRRASAAADEALADARDLEQPVNSLKSSVVAVAMCASESQRKSRQTSFCSSTTSSGSLGKRMVSSSAEPRLRGGARRAKVDGQVVREAPAVCESREPVPEVRAAPADRHAEARGRRWERAVDARERLLERALRVQQIRLRRPTVSFAVVIWWCSAGIDDLDVVVPDDADVAQHVLLEEERQPGGSCACDLRRKPVDEAVQPRRPEGDDPALLQEPCPCDPPSPPLKSSGLPAWQGVGDQLEHRARKGRMIGPGPDQQRVDPRPRGSC